MTAAASILVFLISLMVLWSASQSREAHSRKMTEEEMPLFRGMSAILAGILMWAAFLLATK